MMLKSRENNYEKKNSLEIDEMSCKSLLLWIRSRQQFFGEIDFGDVNVDCDIDDVYNKEDDCEDDDCIDEAFRKCTEKNDGKISEGAICE